MCLANGVVEVKVSRYVSSLEGILGHEFQALRILPHHCLEVDVQICSSASLALPPASLPATDAHTQAVSVHQIANAA